MKTILKNSFQSLLFMLGVMFMLQSCYSIRIATVEGTAEPAQNNEVGFYRDKNVQVIDTTVRLKVLNNEATVFKHCASGGFYSVEYRVTFGMVLLSGITFGKVRKVKVKYVCQQDSN